MSKDTEIRFIEQPIFKQIISLIDVVQSGCIYNYRSKAISLP
jgi:hypothetical protein